MRDAKIQPKYIPRSFDTVMWLTCHKLVYNLPNQDIGPSPNYDCLTRSATQINILLKTGYFKQLLPALRVQGFFQGTQPSRHSFQNLCP